MSFSEILLRWFDENKRDLPWRHESDPYKIWVSEIILQQTRVAQGIGYYHRFIETFPTIQALASASEEQVLKVWQGLGYYSRARNMHTAAQEITTRYQGKFPDKYADIKTLKGIGDYTAAAIASIAFGLPYAAVDGNVLRFVTRYDGIFENIVLATTHKKVKAFCQGQIPGHAAGAFNQAMMEMGATLCVPTQPDCEACPFAHTCYAHIHQQVEQLPYKELKLRIRKRYFHYLIFLNQNQTVIQKRTRNDIWKNLYEFPLIETQEQQFNFVDYLKSEKLSNVEKPQLLWETKHLLTHQSIYAQFWIVSTENFPKIKSNQQIVTIENLSRFAVPKIIEQAIEKLLRS